jgi:ABC-type polar amino acid transport system ATPase subunit
MAGTVLTTPSSNLVAPEVGTAYQPLQTVTVPAASVIPQGLVLVVGPNSSGKTQFLQDIQALLTGQQRTPVVCTGITLHRPKDLDALVSELTEKQWLKRFRNQAGEEYIKANSPLIGIGGPVPSSGER